MTDNFPQLHYDSNYLKEILKVSLQVIRTYDWLIDAYVLDFYVDDHWSELPSSWRNHLEPMDPTDLANILRGDPKCTSVRPLSMLCLMSLMKKLCVPRELKAVTPQPESKCLAGHPKLKNTFTKCVKAKKRHEISQMATLCYDSAVEASVDFLVDFGGGLGHLGRVLGYGYSLEVVCVDMNDIFNEHARIIDVEFEVSVSKHLTKPEKKLLITPRHVTLKLTKSTTPEEFLSKVKYGIGLEEYDEDYTFGIIGLHPCGDLGAILMQMFLSCKEAKFINFVGCCYMKLSTADESDNPGYPLSDFLRKETTVYPHLSYESREIACHASEMYCDRLESGNYNDLKIHSYRATIEKIMVKHRPELKHTGLRNVKLAIGMEFEDYAERAIYGLDIDIPYEDFLSETTRNDLSQWKRIVIFYTMRLMFAPLVESIILYDRILFLQEKGCLVSTGAIFDPRLSPRNFITIATKPRQ